MAQQNDVKMAALERALLQAAQMLSQQPEAMQLRYLQTLGSIAGDKTSTIVFPVPIDMLGNLMGQVKKFADRAG